MDRFVVFLIVVAGLLAANLYVSYLVFRAQIYSVPQKFTQIVLIWLLPIFGFLLVRTFLKEAYAASHAASGEGIGDMSPIDLVTTNPIIASGGNVSDDDA